MISGSVIGGVKTPLIRPYRGFFDPPIMGAVTVVAPDAGPVAETTRVIFLRALELLERGIHAVTGCSTSGLQSGASPRRTAAPVHLCRILRITYHKSQKTIISAQEMVTLCQQIKTYRIVRLAPEPGHVIPGWLCSLTCAAPRGPRRCRAEPPQEAFCFARHREQQLKWRRLPDAEC